jgi:hypothetical protein
VVRDTVLLILLAAGAAGADVPVVSNPATPADGVVELVLEEAWRIGGETENDDEFFGVITQLRCDDEGNVFLLDAQLHEVRVFDAGGELVTVMGREGEGPGEFRRPSDLVLWPGGGVGVAQRMPGKLVHLGLDGVPRGDVSVDLGSGTGFILLNGAHRVGDRLAVSTVVPDRGTSAMTLRGKVTLIESDGTPVTTFLQGTSERDFANPRVVEAEPGPFSLVWETGPEGRIYYSEAFDRYEVHVLDHDGQPLHVITRAYTPVTRTASEKEEVHKRYAMFRGGQRVAMEVEVSDTERDIRRLYPLPGGRLWVLPSQGVDDLPEGVLMVVDEFDADGRFVRQVTLRGEGDYLRDEVVVCGDRLFVVTDQRAAMQGLMGGPGGPSGPRGEAVDEDEEEPMPIAVVAFRIPIG